MKRKILLLALVGIMAIGLFGCGEAPAGSADNTTTNQEENAPVDASSGSLGNYDITIKDATIAQHSYENCKMLIVKYDFTNNGDEPMSASVGVSAIAYQDGIQIENISDYGNPEYGAAFDNNDKNLQKGATIEAICAFKLGESTTPVEVNISDWASFDDAKIVKTFDLTQIQ